MPDIWMDVDTALAEVPVNIFPLIDDTDFKAIEAAIAYNAAGMALYWHFVTTAGAYTVTAVTPTTGGNYDWTDQGDAGIYTIEIPASGGASINNDTEGFGWFTGKATGVLPWRGPVIGFRAAALNNALIDGGDTLDVNATEISGDSTAADNLEAAYDGTGYLPLYHADVHLSVDAANSQDEYTVQWYKNGVPLTSGVSSAQIQVVKRADGTDLIVATNMTQIASTSRWKYDATTTARITAGEAVLAIVTATIDSATRTWCRVIGRDSTA